MKPYLLANGNMMVPKRAASEDGKLIGDGYVELKPDSDEFAQWKDWAEKNGVKLRVVGKAPEKRA